MKRRRGKVETVDNRRRHTCTVCGKQEPWGDTWQWFGSAADLDAGRPILKICSEVCHAEVKAQGGAPRVHARMIREAAA